ncbi:hypothetical protein ACFL2Q_12960 [Thermodesulfobacteriota bacterium]
MSTPRIIGLIAFLLFLPALAGPGFGADSVKDRPSIDLYDLLMMYMIPANAPYDSAPWATGSEPDSPIEWKTSEIRWDDKIKAYAQHGRFLDSVDELTVTLIGPLEGVDEVHVGGFTRTSPAPNLHFKTEGIKFEIYKCDAERFLAGGQSMYKFEVPGKKPAYLLYDWSCGVSGRCHEEVVLFLSRRSADLAPNLVKECHRTECLKPPPQLVALRGMIERRSFPYRLDQDGSIQWDHGKPSLVVDTKPYCVEAHRNESAYRGSDQFTSFWLLFDPGQIAKPERFIGREVIVRGEISPKPGFCK